MKKHLLLIVVLILLAAGILYALNKTNGAPNREKNGFVRQFNGTTATLLKEVNFGWSFRELCGQQGDSLFLMGPDPAKVFMTTTRLDRLDTIFLDIPIITRLGPAFNATVRYPYLYLISSNARRLIKADLRTGKTEITVLPFKGVFHNNVMLDSNRWVIRYIDDQTRNASFKLMDAKGNILTTENNISKPLADAGFLYGGRLNYDGKSGQLIFAHYYTSLLTSFDTAIKLKYEGHTIDTNHTVKTEVTDTKTGVTLKKPPVSLIGHTIIHDGVLYVRSTLMADNEENQKFEKNTVIDKYDVKDGRYLGSFYMASLKGKDVLQYYFIAPDKILGLSNDKVGLFNYQP
ncbi:hypothetical protein [Pedobacter sp. ASV28]|uniref:hypothetical protein n=1 Tax=Pedobacter sp. ASV28 TaxID=2795123 RepID=UPI0018ECA16D|nr:hypothetical protein [Pedobacter sp. ASV28]